MEPKPTVNDIARVADVSLATVDRVLNGRPGVRKATVDKVNRAIQTLGYVRDTAAANLARGRIYRFVFILPEGTNEFLDQIEAQIATLTGALRRERTQVRAVRVAAFDPAMLIAAIDDMAPEDVDGVAIFGPETPSVRDAVDRLKRQGIAVVSLVADQPSSHRDAYIGIDNVAAGRTAAQLMGRFIGGRAGRVLVLSGSMLARDHLERRLGFDEVMARDFPDIEVLASIEGRDDPDLVARLMPRALTEAGEVAGIYASAAGTAGLVSFLQTASLAPKPVVIAHELTPLARQALRSGLFDAVISQDTGHLVRSAVRVMRAHCDALPIDSAQERIRIDIYLNENTPAEPPL